MKQDSQRWTLEKISNVLESRLQGLYYNKGYFKDGIPLLRISDFTKNGKINYESMPKIQISNKDLERFRLLPGDVLVSRTGGAGRSVVFGKKKFDAVFAAYLIRFRFKSEVDPYFVDYFLKSPNSQNKLFELTHGSANKNINAQNILNLDIPIPSIKTQKKIVQKLDSIFDKFERKRLQIFRLNESRISKLTELVSTLTLSVLKSKIPYDNIPQNWQLQPLGELAIVGQGGTPSRSKPVYWNGSIPWLRSGEIINNRILGSNEKITERGLKNSSTKLCPKGTILMAMTGEGLTRGRTSLLEIEACANQSCAHIIIKNDELLNEFLWLFLQSRYWEIRSIKHGSGQPGINTSLIKKLQIPVPPIKEQQKIVNEILHEKQKSELIKNKLSMINQDLKKLTQQIDVLSLSILGEAFLGKLS